MIEKRTIALPWSEVCEIISAEIAQVLGVQIQCKPDVDEENEFWSVEFVNQPLPLPEYCCFVQSLDPALDDWADALPDEVRPDIKDMGPYTGEKIIGHYLHIAWEHQVIAEEALWLVGVTELDGEKPMPDKNGYVLPDDLANAIKAIAGHLHQLEESL